MPAGDAGSVDEGISLAGDGGHPYRDIAAIGDQDRGAAGGVGDARQPVVWSARGSRNTAPFGALIEGRMGPIRSPDRGFEDRSFGLLPTHDDAESSRKLTSAQE